MMQMAKKKEKKVSTEEYIQRLIDGHRQAARLADEQIEYLIETSVDQESIEVFATIFEELVKQKQLSEKAAESLEKELLN